MDSYRSGAFSFDVTDSGPEDGDVVVLLHGFPENRTSWDAVTPKLVAAGYRVLAPDQRGYSPGARPLRRRDYRMDLLVEDIVALADAAGAERVHVVGHDWGGAVAWSFAASHPARCHTVASLCTPHTDAFRRSLLGRQLLRSWYMVFFQLPVIPELGLAGPGKERTRRSMAKTGLPADAVARYLDPLTDRTAARAALNWYRGVPFSRPKVGPIDVPALYVYPTADPFLGRRAADLTARYVRGPYRYEVLEGLGHWLPEEAPDTVASLLLAHVGAPPGSR